MANQITDDRIIITEEYTEDDGIVVKDNPDLPVYPTPEVVITPDDVVNLGREMTTEDVPKTERVDVEEAAVMVFNSFIDVVPVLLPVIEPVDVPSDTGPSTEDPSNTGSETGTPHDTNTAGDSQ